MRFCWSRTAEIPRCVGQAEAVLKSWILLPEHGIWIITAWFLSPWTCRKSRFETSHFMKPTGWGCSSFPHFPFPIWRASPPWCVVIWGVFCVSHPARELSLWNCGFPKTFQLFQGVRWDFHKNLSRAGFGLECSRLTQGICQFQAL